MLISRSRSTSPRIQTSPVMYLRKAGISGDVEEGVLFDGHVLHARR